MKSVFAGVLARCLVVAIALFPFQGVQAGMIGTDKAVTTTVAQNDRAVVLDYLNRSQTVDELQSLGLDPQTARDRVAAMTDAEVASLAGQMNAQPAGGLVVLILVVFFIWYFAFRK